MVPFNVMISQTKQDCTGSASVQRQSPLGGGQVLEVGHRSPRSRLFKREPATPQLPRRTSREGLSHTDHDPPALVSLGRVPGNKGAHWHHSDQPVLSLPTLPPQPFLQKPQQRPVPPASPSLCLLTTAGTRCAPFLSASVSTRKHLFDGSHLLISVLR